MSAGAEEQIRLLIVARYPLRLDDLPPAGAGDFEVVQLIRRPNALELAIDEIQPNVLLVDVGFPEGHGIGAIAEARAIAPEARVLALTPDPPPHEDVAKASRAGAYGFIDIGAGVDEFAEAIRSVHAGVPWLPTDDTLAVLSSVAEDLDVTAAERRSRLTGIVIGLIPLAGAIAAIMSLLWRAYLGHIGVRPVDLAIDPTSRVVNVVFFLLLAIGVFGPLLFVGSWLDLLNNLVGDRKGFAWIEKRRKIAHVTLSLGVLALGTLLAVFADLLLVVFIGPMVGISLVARAIDLTDELPAALRITRMRPARVFSGGLLVLALFLTILSTEALLTGPDLRPDGAHGILAPRVLGFSAQPMQAFEVDGSRAPREVLYLGGNADLYVLVDPCDEDTVEFVSVGSTRLVVIDEVACETGT
jgi:DNA-binding NarL/FixJ family response regulator